jgi:hypothetical protein
LANPDSAARCDCGYTFSARRDAEERANSQNKASTLMWMGIALMACGGVFTAVSFRNGSGPRVIWYGAVISGLLMAVRGLTARDRLR